MLYFFQKLDNGDKQDNWKNIIFQTSIFIGISLQILLYSLEWYSRINCPLQVGFVDKIFQLFFRED